MTVSQFHNSYRRSPTRSHARSRGFSFTEIMFAVIVLGIGFIMVAAIFPVAIQQGKVSTEESSAANLAREGLAYLAFAGANGDAIPDSKGGPLFPATGSSATAMSGRLYSFNDGSLDTGGTRPNHEIWNMVRDHLIMPTDQRFAFAGMYRRDGNPGDAKTWSPFAQVWFIPVTSRNRSTYDPSVDFASGSTNLEMHSVLISIDQPLGITTTLHPTPGYVVVNWVLTTVTTPSPLAEGAYVIIADDKITTPAVNTGRMNGRIYHVGGRRPDLDHPGVTINGKAYNGTVYDLSPDGDFTPDAGFNGKFDPKPTPPPYTPDPTSDDIFTVGLIQQATPSDASQSTFGNASGPASAWVLGMDQSAGAGSGKAQDISAYTTFIKVN